MSPNAAASKPDFIIIGAQRAGSTWLNHTLRSHPQVVLPRTEIPYFEDPAYRSNHDPLRRIASRAEPGQIWGFKRPDLLGRPECPSRIRDVAPDAKLIVSLREPIARTISAYYLAVRTRSLPQWPLNEGLRRILRGKCGNYGDAEWVISFGLYATHLRHYLDFFPRSSLLVLLFDDIVRSPQESSDTVCNFLGVIPDGRVPPPPRNQNVYAPLRIRLHRIGSLPLYVRGRDGQHRARLGIVPRGFAKGVGIIDRGLVAPWVDGSNHPEQLDNDVREELAHRLGADFSYLESLLGRPLDSWQAAMAGASIERGSSPS